MYDILENTPSRLAIRMRHVGGLVVIRLDKATEIATIERRYVWILRFRTLTIPFSDIAEVAVTVTDRMDAQDMTLGLRLREGRRRWLATDSEKSCMEAGGLMAAFLGLPPPRIQPVLAFLAGNRGQSFPQLFWRTMHLCATLFFWITVVTTVVGLALSIAIAIFGEVPVREFLHAPPLKRPPIR
jgi:hypothetical protein